MAKWDYSVCQERQKSSCVKGIKYIISLKKDVRPAIDIAMITSYISSR